MWCPAARSVKRIQVKRSYPGYQSLTRNREPPRTGEGGGREKKILGVLRRPVRTKAPGQAFLSGVRSLDPESRATTYRGSGGMQIVPGPRFDRTWRCFAPSDRPASRPVPLCGFRVSPTPGKLGEATRPARPLAHWPVVFEPWPGGVFKKCGHFFLIVFPVFCDRVSLDPVLNPKPFSNPNPGQGTPDRKTREIRF